MEKDSNINLKWGNHHSTLKVVFDTLLDTETLSDCTVGAEGQHLKAHKVILSAFSRYFELLFRHHCGKDIIIILPGVKFHILKALMEFMYRGEIYVPQDELDVLLKLADFLQVKGLSSDDNELAEKKQKNERRDKSPTYSQQVPSECRALSESYEHCDSPELLEVSVSGSKSQSECLQKQECTTVAPSSTSASKRRKSDWQSSWENPLSQQDLLPPSHTVSHTFPLQRSELPDKNKSSCDIVSDPKPGPSLTSQLPVFREENFNNATESAKELTCAKSLNSALRTSVCPTVSVETFTEPKKENCSVLNADYMGDVTLGNDNTQCQNVCDDNSIVTSELGENSLSVEPFTQQMQFQQTEWTNMDPTEQNRFKCKSCHRSYRTQGTLQRHVKYECGKEPQFQCPNCLHRFNHKHHLQVHMLVRNH